MIYSILYALHGGVGAPFISLSLLAFWVWMAFDCWKNQRDSYWLYLILVTGGFGALVYFLTHFVQGSNLDLSLWNRLTLGSRIREQKGRAYHLGTAGAFEQLGDLNMRALRWAEAEAAYRESLQKDSENLDVQARLGYVLMELGRYDEAWSTMAPVYQKKPNLHDDELLRKLARCQAARRKFTDAKNLYEYYLRHHSYADAQYEYGEVLLAAGDMEEGQRVLQELIYETEHSPDFIRRRDSKWARAARRSLKASQQHRSNEGPSQS